ncbi:hypothetical protein SAMN05192574_106109 [Mucilaginibacter gossypiicola]|uniref:PKD domain-containing protein n=1 Tax=Mucilaginibacter gossypiicola TaxID=551995 RepID=A0A1H8MVX0_9SPHI|nr:hypothetical protein [Mucilaginibacter gossypiicola]SEO21424.1 hypothetical protein SAMN05192574_106109 [Mucilaginibacter gossypiicola]
MKILKSPLALLCLVLLIITACQKNGIPNAPAGQIAISKLKVKIDEPDSMLLVGADTTKAVTWTISPAGSDEMQTHTIGAVIKFSKAGNYTIKASNGDETSNTLTVTVIDSVYAPVYNTDFSAGEQISMTPRIIKSTKSDSSYIGFTATTKNSYCTNSHLEFGVWFGSNPQTYFIQFNGIFFITPGCGAGSQPVTGTADFSSYLTPLTPGIYPLNILFHDIGYNGTVEVTPTQVIFHWDNASSGIIISPTTLTR